jgi:galactokinase/mevalonate kinase-like predicted kinase
VWNWQATVTLSPQNADNTPYELPDDSGLKRIMEPTITVFENHFGCTVSPFKAEVNTTIPYRVGLSGSSAIETAFMLTLMAYHNIPMNNISARELAELVLKVEAEELGIVAGLQDRLPQAYGCMLYMDFAYTELNAENFPLLWVAHAPSGEDSGKTHSGIAERWQQQDSEMIEIIQHLADCANEAPQAIDSGDSTVFASLIDTNFDLRLELFGEEALGETLDAVKLARSLGSCAKQCGSGGSIFGIIPNSDFPALAAPAFSEMGWTFHTDIEVAM